MVSFFNPVSLMYTGVGVIGYIPDHLKERGLRRPLMVTDKGIASLPFFKELIASLPSPVIFDQTDPNPPDTQVHEGAALYIREQCDCIIAMGGGSPMDCAKGIGVVAVNGGPIHTYAKAPNSIPKPIPHLMAIPTTAGSGSECTAAAIITNTEGHHAKMAIVSPRLLPAAAFIDPEIMRALPAPLTAATGIDALSHAIEAYLANAANEYTDGLAFNAIRLIFKYLPRVVANGNDMIAREKMAYAQSMAGLAFNCAGLGLVHAMSHPLSATYGIAHGGANAILLPWVMDFNAIARLEKTIEIAEAAGENVWGLSKRDAATLAPRAVRTLCSDLGAIMNITEAVAARGQAAHFEADIDSLVKDALNDMFIQGNPRNATAADIRGIYASCWSSATLDLIKKLKGGTGL
jgi:alcohol dehydrogenase